MSLTTNKYERFNVGMFDKLNIRYHDIELNSEMIGSNMMELLLVYILCNRNQEISTSELCEVLWSDEESDNPLGALKNLMYRLRTLLKKTFVEENFIITGRGTYYWNKNIPVTLDIEEFERLLEISKKEEILKKKRNVENALALYCGSFLPKHLDEHWILQRNTYYQSLYSDAIKVLVEIYQQDKEYEKLEALCNTALKYDYLDERIHGSLISGLIAQDKKSLAMQHYLYVKKVLYEELGVAPSKELQEYYQVLLKQQNTREMDLNIIQRDLTENNLPKEAFMCDYNVFKLIYQLEARRLDRLGMSIYCCLLSADTSLDIPTTSNIYIKMMDDVMKTLGSVVQRTLRIGDVVSRYSSTQYVVLLPGCSFESSKMVIERVINAYNKQENIRKNVTIKYDLKELIYPKKK